jgi:hypothetical protein
LESVASISSGVNQVKSGAGRLNSPIIAMITWSIGAACGLQAMKSCGSRTAQCSAVSRCALLLQAAGWPPTLGSVGRASGRWLAMWIIAVVWIMARRAMRSRTDISRAGP